MNIYKYALTPAATLQLPEDAVFLCVQTQRGDPQMWFLVNEHAPKITRNFIVRATGEQFTQGGPERYLGTFQLEASSLVFHAFELL